MTWQIGRLGGCFFPFSKNEEGGYFWFCLNWSTERHHVTGWQLGIFNPFRPSHSVATWWSKDMGSSLNDRRLMRDGWFERWQQERRLK